MRIVRTVREVRAALEPRRAAGPIGLVPTMGAYHAGHLSLFRAARDECETVVASLFVNPAQFSDDTDLRAYPRDEEGDAALAQEAGVDLLFTPSERELYRPGHETWVDVGALGDRLEGEARPGHFRGVATVCLKLFNIVRPQRAYFGQKDVQQLAVVRALVRDLDVALEVRALPTVRDADGLALSSRNRLLAADERERALALPRALNEGRAAFARGDDPVAAAAARLNGLPAEYLEVARFDGALVLAAAVRIGRTRLIDNVVLATEGASS
jgi:pantoate--beta-alanine ligase